MQPLEGRQTEDQGRKATGQRDRSHRSKNQGKRDEADHDGVFEVAANGAGDRAGKSEGDQGDMGGTRNDIQWREIAYDPLPSQKLFHSSEARFKGFSGPIGSGKSQALCQEAIKLSYVNAGRLGLLGAPTYPMLRDATQATLFEILETNKIQKRRA